MFEFILKHNDIFQQMSKQLLEPKPAFRSKPALRSGH